MNLRFQRNAAIAFKVPSVETLTTYIYGVGRARLSAKLFNEVLRVHSQSPKLTKTIVSDH